MARKKEDGIITDTQEKIIRWLSRGLSTSQVAEKMNTTQGAIHTQMYRIRERLDASNNIQAIMYLWLKVDPS